MDVQSVVDDRSWNVDELVADITARNPGSPFGEPALAFCSDLSRRLLGDPRSRALPAIAALGFWLRPASIERLRRRFVAAENDSVLFVPRGVVFHVTPANVDTIFAYSWILSMLVGNVDVVRLSSRTSEVSDALLAAIRATFDTGAADEVRARSYLVRTAHDDRISAALSSIASVRVVWGGDSVVEHFRRFPLPPRGRDVTFPNRHSFAIVDAGSVDSASDSEISTLADAFFNDAYWFDQGACSSPRLVVWQALDGVNVNAARSRLHDAVDAAIKRRGYQAPTGLAISKMTYGLRRAASADGVEYDRRTNEATWVLVPDLTVYDRDSCGGGLFFEFVSRDLEADLLTLVEPRDQTAATYGIDAAGVRRIAGRLNGRGVDRFVPVGRALEFSAIWDGYDLLQEFSRRVVVDV